MSNKYQMDFKKMKISSLLFWTFTLSSILFFVSYFKTERLTDLNIDPALNHPPLQTPLRSEQIKPFVVRLQGHRYFVTPKFNYKLKGLVVSKSNSQSWRNISHAKWGDYFNIGDLCIVWGENVKIRDFNDFDFWNGDWTCYVRTNSSVAWANFKMNQLSNNHILPATPDVEKQFKSIRIGDQIEFSGELVSYSIDNGPERETSISREDTGNGACEVIHVRSISVIHEGHSLWRKWERFFSRLALLSFIGWFFYIFIMPFFRTSTEL